MKFTDLCDITKEGDRGLCYESEDRCWRVARAHMGPTEVEWHVYQAHAGRFVRRVRWASMATEAEGMAVASVLAALPLAASPAKASAATRWYAGRLVTVAFMRSVAAFGRAVLAARGGRQGAHVSHDSADDGTADG